MSKLCICVHCDDACIAESDEWKDCADCSSRADGAECHPEPMFVPDPKEANIGHERGD